jgi:hypothetical protein
MTRLLVLSGALVALALPAPAGAAGRDPLKGAKLRSAAGTLTMLETRCPPDTPMNCGKVQIDEKFATAPKPKIRSVPGRPGFPTGIRIAGRGSGQCSIESTVPTAQEPGQLIGSALRVSLAKFTDTPVAVARSRRGVRFAWLEPLAPGVPCDYFGQAETNAALPPAATLPKALISPTIGRHFLQRKRFSVTIAGSQQWTETAADGTIVNGTASWRLRLDYAR